MEEARRGDYVAVPVGGRACDVILQVIELELGGRADDLRGLRWVADPGQLDDDLILALLPGVRLGDAKLVDPVPHDRDGAVHVRGGELVALGRNRL